MLKPRMAATSVVSVAVFLGAAVFSAGGLAAFLARPPYVALVAITGLLVVAALFTNAHLGSGVQEDRGNRWVIAALGVLGLAAAIASPICDRFDFAVIDGDAMRWTGVALYALGGALRLAPVFILAERFSGLVAIQPGHRLVTTGLYGVIRHPSYLGMIVLSLGWALAFRSALGAALVAAMLIPVVARIKAEERLLGHYFGAAYETYRARTWRLVPGLW